MENGKVSIDQVNNSVKKILRTKYELGLDTLVLPIPAKAVEMAFDHYAIGVKHKLIEDAITVAQNKRAYIPIVNVVKPKIATIAIGSSEPTPFQNRIDSYVQVDHYFVSHSLKEVDVPQLLKDLQQFDRIIVSVHNINNKVASNFGLTKEELGFIQNLNRSKEIILVIFGSPYSLKFLKTLITSLWPMKISRRSRTSLRKV